MQDQNQKPKKYKKIILTGLHIPPPPPSLTIITSSTTTTPTHTEKQQSIQKSSSSSEQQTFYENYFHNKLESMIQELLGEEVEYEIMELRESKKEQELNGKKNSEDVVDVVLKVAVMEEKAGELKEKIGSMKKKIIEKSQDKDLKKTIKKNSTKKSKPSVSLTKKQKASPIKKKPMPVQTPSPSSSSEQQQRNFQDPSSRNLNLIDQTAQNIQISEQNVSSMVIFNNRSSRIGNNKQIRNKSGKKQEKYGKVQNEQQSSSQDEKDTNINRDRKRTKSNSRQAKKFRKFCLSLTIGLVLLAALASSIIFLTRQIEKIQQNNQKQKIKQIPRIPPTNKGGWVTSPKQNRPHQGQIGQKLKKSQYIIPSSKQEQSTKTPVYVQIIPSVTAPQHSLHPRNISYIRPSFVALLTFHEILIENQYKLRNTRNILNFTHTQEEIQKYLASLGKSNQSIIRALYTELHKNQNSSLLLEAQYLHLSKKYDLPQASHLQKPLCIVAYGQNLYQSNKFLPFFQSLFNQNYTKYRLVYIDNGPKDEYNSIKIMNYLWNNFYQKLGIIGSNNFYFARLDKKLSKGIAKLSIIRETCGDGDIVIDIDATSQFVGRQVLGVISSVYDGGSQRILSIPKDQVDRYLNPQKYAQRNLKKDTPEPFRYPKMSNKNNPATNSGPQQQPQQTQKKNDKIVTQQRVFVSRKIMNKWAAYTNYIYTEVSRDLVKDTEQINYKFVNSTDQLVKMRDHSQKGSNFEQVRKKLDKNYLSNVCLKTYVVPLQTKIPYTKLIPKIKSKSKQSKYHESYLYDIELMMSLLEISGKFSQKPKKFEELQNVVEIPQPLCYRSDVNIVQKCEQMKKVYEELIFMGRTQMSYLSGEIEKQESFSVQKMNRKLENFNYLHYLQKVREQMQKICES